MPPRLHSSAPLAAGHRALDDAAARHVRVLRLDAGAALTLFDGRGGEWRAQVQQTRADSVTIEILEHVPVERELGLAVHLAVGMPANDRMDFLVEKATELGAASIQPLVTERSVLRLTGDRGAKKRVHWQAVATAACEQCGRNRVPAIGLPIALPQWLTHIDESHPGAVRWLLSLPVPPRSLRSLPPEGAGPPWERPGGGPPTNGVDAAASAPASAPAPAHGGDGTRELVALSGPEGGLSDDEQRACVTLHGFVPRSLGPRVLRAETAPLALLAMLCSSLA